MVESPGPATRLTELVFSEIMYRPLDFFRGYLGSDLDFIEIYNAGAFPEDIGGYSITGDISFVFPTNYIKAPGAYVVIADKPKSIAAVYGISNAFNFSGNLPDDHGTIRLCNRMGAVLLEVNYSAEALWPQLANGKGRSLVLARPSYGIADRRAWDISEQDGGSPGGPEPIITNLLHRVCINEFLANSSLPEFDFLELYNKSAREIDLSGCSLSDSPSTNKFVFAGATIGAGSYLALDELSLGFSLKSSGDTIYFRAPNGEILDAVRYGPQDEEISQGRVPEGGTEFFPLFPPTPFAQNDTIYRADIVINEIMYAPFSGLAADQYIELYNRSTNSISLEGWSLTDAINYTIPAGTTIPPRGYLVVAKDAANIIGKYSNLNHNNTVGNYKGALANEGAHIILSRPQLSIQDLVTNLIYVVEDEVNYGTAGDWGRWSHGRGSSLELIDPWSEGRFAANWADSDETGKAPETVIEFTGNFNAYAPAVQLLQLGEGECLVETVEVSLLGGLNLAPDSMASTNWLAMGNHSRSSPETNQPGLHLRASASGDTAANHIRAGLPSLPYSSPATLRVRARWISGNPFLVLRVEGGSIEASGMMTVPPNLGTPGMPNSRLIANAGPCIQNVSLNPILPASGQAVTITAQVNDSDGIGLVLLRYRLDPNTNYSELLMRDDGTGGDTLASDGIYSATIPGQPGGRLAAFYIQATDAAIPAANSRFPSRAPEQECLIRFGEPNNSGTFGDLKIWMTTSNMAQWTARSRVSEEPLDCTVVYNDQRVIFNAGIYYGGQNFERPSYTSPTNGFAAYTLRFPAGQRLLGCEIFHLESLDPTRDPALLRERAALWMAQQLNLPIGFQRFLHVSLNGVKDGARGVPLFIDRQLPDADFIKTWFSSNPTGELFEISEMLEQANANAFQYQKYASLQDVSTIKVQRQKSDYRWNWKRVFNQTYSDDYLHLFGLADAFNAPDSTFQNHLEGTIDLTQWIASLAFRHAVGDGDSYGYHAGRNGYIYKPVSHGWQLLFGRFQNVFGANSIYAGYTLENANTTEEPEMVRFYSQGDISRKYLAALQKTAAVLDTNKVQTLVLDPYAQVLASKGIISTVAARSNVLSWIQARHNYILTQLGDFSFSVTSTNFVVVTNGNYVVLSGTAGQGITNIDFFGSSAGSILTWTSARTWTAQVLLESSTASLTPVVYQNNGQSIVENQYSTIISNTVGNNYVGSSVAISEIKYGPIVPGAGYLELFNPGANIANLSQCVLPELGFTFAAGTFLQPQSYGVLSEDRSAFTTAYGTTISLMGELGQPVPFGGIITLAGPLGNELDKIKYETNAPWPLIAGTSNSLQLVDWRQDHARVDNWSPPPQPWRFFSYTGSLNSNPAPILRLWLAISGDTYLDDLFLASGSSPEAGANLIRKGDFENAILSTNFGGVWGIIGAYTNSQLSTQFKHSGNASLHLVGTAPGSSLNFISQNLSAIESNSIWTLSFWYLTGANSNALTVRLSSTFQPIVTIPKPKLSSLGSFNSFERVLPQYPPLWLNEIQPVNLAGIVDNHGEHEPWFELYNSSTNPISLAGFYLADNYTNLEQWPFPTNAFIGPREYKIIFLDGQPEQTTSAELHSALSTSSGQIAFSVRGSDGVQILDYLNYAGVTADKSYGALPDGQLFYRAYFSRATPRAGNRMSSIFINEWMASNTRTIANGLNSGKYDDWFELYNADSNSVSISGLYLTHTLSVTNQYLVPAGYVIPPHGYLFVWADAKPSLNPLNHSELHVPFNLNKGGDAIGLFTSEGLAVDTIVFGAQSSDISQGRWPDGNENLRFMPLPTPGASNRLINTSAPVLAAISNQIILPGENLLIPLTATDADTPLSALRFSLLSGAPAGASLDPTNGVFRWTPSLSQASSTSLITVQVADDGIPPLSDSKSFHIIVGPTLRLEASASQGGEQFSVIFPTVPGRSYEVDWKDQLQDPWVTNVISFTASNQSTIFLMDRTNNQRFFRVLFLQ